MFGGKKKATVFDEQESRNASYRQEFEYRTISAIGGLSFDKMLNEDAAKGWELVNGAMAGTAHFGYLRRRLMPSNSDT